MPRHSDATKAEAVARIRAGRATPAEEAERVGVHVSTIHKWAQQSGEPLPDEEGERAARVARAHAAADENGSAPTPTVRKVKARPTVEPEAPPIDVEREARAVVAAAEFLTRLSAIAAGRVAKLDGAELSPMLAVDPAEREILTTLAIQGLPVMRKWSSDPTIASYVFLGLWSFTTLGRCWAILSYGRARDARAKRARGAEREPVPAESAQSSVPRSAADMPPPPIVGGAA